MAATTTTVPAIDPGPTLALAARLSAERDSAAGDAQRARDAETAARAAMYAAERETAAAAERSTAAAHTGRHLARALAWNRHGIIAEDPTDVHTYNGDGTRQEWRTAFGAATVSTAPHDRGAAPKARAYVWATTDNGGRETVAEWSPRAGTRDAAKLAAQVVEAAAFVSPYLVELTAERWLVAHGIDPETAPALADVATVAVDLVTRGYGSECYTFPRWSLMLGGWPVASIDDRRDLLTRDDLPSENGHDRWAAMDTVLGPVPTESHAAIVAYAERHAERAMRAMLAGFAPDGREGR